MAQDINESEVTEEDVDVVEETTEDEIQSETPEEVLEEQKSDDDIEIIKARVAGQKVRIEDLEKMLEAKADDIEKLNRLKADFENFKTRTVTERSQAKVKGKIKAINEVLDVFDNLERAMAFKSETEEFKTGLVMINNNLRMKLETMGAKFEEQND